MIRSRQFSLGSLLLATVLIAGGLGLWRGVYHPLVRQQEAIRVLQASEAIVVTKPNAWSWRNLIFDEASLVDVIEVDLSPMHVGIIHDLSPTNPSLYQSLLPPPARGPVVPAVLAALPNVRGLVRLNLAERDVGDEIAPTLARLTTLTELDLRGTRIGDATVAAAATLPRLKTLHLGQTEVTPAAITSIKAMPALETLGLARGLTPRRGELAEMTTLRHLFDADSQPAPQEWIDSSITRIDHLYRDSSGFWSRRPRVPVLPTDRAARAVLLSDWWSVVRRADSLDDVPGRWRTLANADGLTELVCPPGLPDTIPEDAFDGLAELESITFTIRDFGRSEAERFHRNPAEQIAILAKLPNLRTITLDGMLLQSPKVYSSLATLPYLERLTLRFDLLSGLLYVPGPPLAKLIEAEIGQAHVELADEIVIGRVVTESLADLVEQMPESFLETLIQLHVSGRLDDKVVTSLGRLPRLDFLTLDAADLSPDSVQRLARCERPRVVRLNGTPTPDIAAELAAWPLTDLTVHLTKLDDQAGQAVEPLLGATRIDQLTIVHPEMTPEWAASTLTASSHPGPWTSRPRSNPHAHLPPSGHQGQAVVLGSGAASHAVAFASSEDYVSAETIDPQTDTTKALILDRMDRKPTEHTDHDLAEQLGRMDRVVTVRSRLDSITDALIESLGSRPSLRSIEFSLAGMLNLADSSGQKLATSSSTTSWTRLADALAATGTVENVRIDSSLRELTADQVAAFGQIRALTTFWSLDPCSYESLEGLRGRRSLQGLVLPWCQPLAETELATWNRARLKAAISASGPPPMPAATPYSLARTLASWPDIEVLVLTRLPLDLDALVTVANGRRLTHASINIADLSPDEAAVILTTPRLKSLELAGCSWSDAEKQAFEQRPHNVRVITWVNLNRNVEVGSRRGLMDEINAIWKKRITPSEQESP